MLKLESYWSNKIWVEGQRSSSTNPLPTSQTEKLRFTRLILFTPRSLCLEHHWVGETKPRLVTCTRRPHLQTQPRARPVTLVSSSLRPPLCRCDEQGSSCARKGSGLASEEFRASFSAAAKPSCPASLFVMFAQLACLLNGLGNDTLNDFCS